MINHNHHTGHEHDWGEKRIQLENASCGHQAFQALGHIWAHAYPGNKECLITLQKVAKFYIMPPVFCVVHSASCVPKSYNSPLQRKQCFPVAYFCHLSIEGTLCTMPVCPVCAIGSARPMEHFTPKKLDSYGKKGCYQINLGASLCQVTSWWCFSYWRTSYQLIEKPHRKLFITWVSLSYASTIEVTTQLCRLGSEVRYNLLRRISTWSQVQSPE